MNDNEKKFSKKIEFRSKPEPRVKFIPFEPLADRPFSHVPDMSAEEFEARFQAQLEALRQKKESEPE